MVIILILAVTALVDAETGVARWLELRDGLARSGDRVERLMVENESLRREIELLEQDPTAIERVIREELDQALPGEVVIRFRPGPARSAAPPADGNG
jgi:cell division protein FtsB